MNSDNPMEVEWNELPDVVRDYAYALMTRLMTEGHQRVIENELRACADGVSAKTIDENGIVAKAQADSMAIAVRILRRLDHRFCENCGEAHEDEEPHVPLDPKKLS